MLVCLSLKVLLPKYYVMLDLKRHRSYPTMMQVAVPCNIGQRSGEPCYGTDYGPLDLPMSIVQMLTYLVDGLGHLMGKGGIWGNFHQWAPTDSYLNKSPKKKMRFLLLLYGWKYFLPSPMTNFMILNH